MKVNWKRLSITIGIVFLTMASVSGSMQLVFRDAINVQKEQIDTLETQIETLSEQIMNIFD